MKKYFLIVLVILTGCASNTKQTAERTPQQVGDYGSDRSLDYQGNINEKFIDCEVKKFMKK